VIDMDPLPHPSESSAEKDRLLFDAWSAIGTIIRLGFSLDPDWPNEADSVREAIGNHLWP